MDKVPAVDIVITSDGLRVSVFDREDTPLFKANHTQLTPWANFVVQNLAWLIARYPFEIIVESYTSEMPAEGIDGMHRGDTAWELSSRRGNIFRQRLQFYANEQLNFRSVVGYGSNASFTDEEITRGKTNQHIALSLSLSNAQRPLNFT
ncbi:hypothetical protein RZS08_30335, partial [Arthrospira platensis SPKY1]|nr:hypothetical protein [Arthrospira platensis SPKY1]